jgi:ubiquitin carboxyl-terminal hydrolase 34
MNPRENMELTPDAVMVIQKIYGVLLGLLSTARDHADASPSKLVSYFTVMTHCLIGKQEKLMLVPYFNDLWNLFQPKLSEPPIATNQNKQALLNFWFQACQDCPENIQCIVNSPQAVKNIAFNYILADHEDHEIIAYNRLMLPCYYGILRMCCQHSRAFTRQLAGHQNITWAFKNITPHMNHYAQASQELFKLMELFIQVNEETTETEKRQINEFKKSILHMYLTQLDSRNNWCAIVRGIQTLMRDPEDIAFVILNNGMFCLLSAFHTLFVMFHEATACHVSNDIVDVLKIVGTLLDFMTSTPLHEVKEWTHKWKEQSEQIKKLVYMLNSYTTQEVRVMCMIILEKFVILYPKESVPVLVQFLGLGHLTFQDTNLSCKFRQQCFVNR